MSLVCMSFTIESDTDCLCADIVILSDFSGSMNGSEKVVSQAIEMIVSGIPPEENIIRFALISFAGQRDSKIEVALTSDYKRLLDGVRLYEKKMANSEETHIYPAFNIAQNIFRTSNQYQDCFRIIIVMSDGKLTDREIALKHARKMRESTDWPISIFTLSSVVENDTLSGIQIGPRVLLPIISGSSNIVDEAVLDSLSGGAYFKNNVDALKEKIREYDMCL